MTEHKSHFYRFGDIEVRETEFAFTRAGERVRVEPTAFRVLLHLLRNPGHLVTKAEILTAVWPHTAVSDNSLTRSIATLRRLLNDSSRQPQYIATIQTLGYRFLLEVAIVEDRDPNPAVSLPASPMRFPPPAIIRRLAMSIATCATLAAILRWFWNPSRQKHSQPRLPINQAAIQSDENP